MAKELYNLGFDGVTQCQGFEEDGKRILTTTMPQAQVNQILEQNKALKNANGRLGANGGVAARIDRVTHYNWKQEWRKGPKAWGQPWHKFLMAKLKDPANKHMLLVDKL